MDRDLLRQSLSYHGHNLLSLLKCEQSENPQFNSIVSELSKASRQSKKDRSENNATVQQFIARKADLLFAPSWKTYLPTEDAWEEDSGEPYSIMPPLEQFMAISFEERKDLFYRDVEQGDVVIGSINSIRDFGFFVTLLCTGGGLERDIEDLELTALCPLRDVPSNGNHDDPLSYYQMGDLIRAGVKDIDRYHGKLTISLQPSSLAANLAKLKLGIISRDDLPLHYSRGLQVANDSTETYERVLESSVGFSNPSCVEFLLGKLGISETQPPSFMRGLQRNQFQEEDFATSIRKKQSTSWALKCVKAGVDHFKSGQHVEAMNEYNKALELDTNNVEALVARGALYATKGSLMKAIEDFELALESCPTHRNAKKYLCQTLIERGGQLEEEEKFVTAEGLYRKALTLDESFQDAKEALRKIQLLIQNSLKLREEEAAKEQEKAKNVETSAEKLRKILKEEKRVKKKRKRSSSSSSCMSHHSSLSSSSDRRKSKKSKHKHKRSSRGHKKRRRKLLSRDGKSVKGEEEEDWYPAPPITSASFMDQKNNLDRQYEGLERADDGMLPRAKKRQSCNFMSSALTEAQDNSRGRFEDDSFFRFQQQADSKMKDYHGSRPSGLGFSDGEENGRGTETLRARRNSDEDQGGHQELYSTSDKARHRKFSTSSAGSEYSRKSERHTSEFQQQRDYDRGSDSGKYDHYERSYRTERDRNTRKSNESYPNKASAADPCQNKDVPVNLLDIFSQISQFEKEKCTKAKK